MPPSLPSQNEVLQIKVGKVPNWLAGRFFSASRRPWWGCPRGCCPPFGVGFPGGLADSRPGTFSTVLNPGES